MNFAILKSALVEKADTLERHKIVGHHKIRVLRERYRARVIQNKSDELRAGELVHPLDRDPERHNVSAPEIISGFFFSCSEITDKFFCFLVCLVAYVDRVERAGRVGVACEYLRVYVFGNEAREDRQVGMPASIAVKKVGPRVERKRGVRISAFCKFADRSCRERAGSRE